MSFEQYKHNNGGHIYEIDSTHTRISIRYNGEEVDSIPVNIEGEINREKFSEFVINHARSSSNTLKY